MEIKPHVVTHVDVEDIKSVGEAPLREYSMPSSPILSIKLNTVSGLNFDFDLRESVARKLYELMGNALNGQS